MQSVSPLQKHRARRLRKVMTPSETRIWAALRDRRYAGLKFRRQQVLGNFIIDFCCCEKRVIVELDGESHSGKEVYDFQRQQWLENDGWRVLRFWDHEVFGNIDGVMQAIYSACLANPSPHPASDTAARLPSPAGGEGNGKHPSP